MSSGKWMNTICICAIVLSLVVSVFSLIPGAKSEQPVKMAYESRLFDTSRVHTIDIRMSGWDEFLKTCANEEYALCDVTIDGESFTSAAIRAKGNTSLSSVSQMDSDRYSFKIEFDHYDSAFSYYGLDKLSLNNLIQDNTFMKDYLTYRMMNEFGVPAPLTSFVYITVNGEDWGLYLAVEGVEDAFLLRNYGRSYGELYKPDSMSFGGGRGNGKDFDMSDFEGMFGEGTDLSRNAFQDKSGAQTPPVSVSGGRPDMFAGGNQFGGFGGMGSSDVKLQYSDDDFDSYKNIFDNAKTDVTDADKTRLIDALKRLSQGDVSAVDQEDVLRYFVVHNFVVNDDSYTGTMIHNYYLYEKDGALSMIPWDYNLAYGTFQGANASSSVNKDIDNPVSGSMSDRPMLSWIFLSDEYTQKYHALFEQFLSSVDAQGIIEEAEGLIAPYVEKDPTRFCTVEEFKNGVSALKTFVSLRRESVLNQLSGTDKTVSTVGLTVSDMGTMSNGMGFGNRNGAQMPQMPEGGFTMPTDGNGMPQMPEGGFTVPTGGNGMPQMPEGGFTMPTGGNGMPQMPEGGFTMPTNGNGMPQMPEGGFTMPTNGSGMPQMPGNGFGSQAGETGASIAPAASAFPTSAPVEDVKGENQKQPSQSGENNTSSEASRFSEAQSSASGDQNKNAQSNQRESSRSANSRMGSWPDFAQSGAQAESGRKNASGETLLISSVIVLLASLAIALWIKH